VNMLCSIFFVVYLIGVVLAYGLVFGFAQSNWKDVSEYEYNRDLIRALIYSPLSWITVFDILLYWVNSDKKLYLKFY
jgi:hypothetical protein